MPCPDSNALQALLEGTLAQGEREALLAHAADCADCRALLRTLVTPGAIASDVETIARRTRSVAALRPDTRVERFIIDGRLGGGAMGDVYSARDPELDRRVAIKLLRADPDDEDDALERRARMQREAQALARVRHANVMTVFDVGAYGDQVFLAMELIDGWTVRGWLAAEPRGWRAVVETYLAAARGLAAAHAAGIVHRDFKPDNVLVGRDGRVLVTDFGLARRVDEPAAAAPGPAGSSGASTLTRTGALLGTPAYMSPEQHDGAPADEASDQFSLCVALHEGLYGERPFPGRTVEELRHALRRGVPRPPPPGRRVPRALRRIVRRGLAIVPGERYPSLAALIGELEATLRPRRLVWLGAAAAVALLAAVAVLGRAHPAAPGPRPGVAVLPLANGAGRPQLGWLVTALPEMLTTELGAGEKLRTVPVETARRLQLGPGAEAAGRLGARYLVTGSFVPAGDRIRVDLRLEEPGGAGVLAAYGETVAEADLVELAARAGARFRHRLGVPDLSAEETGRLRATQPANPEAARLFADAQERLRAGDEPGALPLLEASVARDPRFALGQAELASALWDLGYGVRARAAAEAARALARGLRREEQLLVEARAAHATGDEDAAVERYQLLYGFFPDRHEYGVELLLALNTARRAKEAAALLARLRAAGPPVADDIQLDRIETVLASEGDDLEHAAAAAVRLAERARAQAVPYLATDALFSLAEALLYRGRLRQAARATADFLAAAAGLNDPKSQAMALRTLGVVRKEQGRLGEARALLEEALALDRKVGMVRAPFTPLQLAELTALGGRLADGEAQRAAADVPDTRRAPGHAAIALLRGDLEAAQRAVEVLLASAGDSPSLQGRALLLRARIRHAQGDFAAARAGYDEAAAVARRARHELTLARAELGLAALAVDEGRPPDDHLRAALPALEREGLLPDLAWAAALAGDAARARLLGTAVEDVASRDLVLLAAGVDPDEILRRAQQAGFVLVAMEARLVRARLGREPRAVLEREARARGLGRIARLAAK